MWFDNLEEQYKKHENIVKGIAGLTLGTIVGMWVYSKYKESRVSKIVDKGLEIEKKVNELSQEVKSIKEEIE